MNVELVNNCIADWSSLWLPPSTQTLSEWAQDNFYLSPEYSAQLRRDVETALRDGRLSYEESGALLRFYEEGLHRYTYLEDAHEH